MERDGGEDYFALVVDRHASSQDSSPGRHPVVLVVEDEPLLRGTTAEFLRLCEFVVVETATPTDAVSLLETGEHVDAVFSDVYAPGPIDGLAFARWLSRRRPGLPVLLTSGYGRNVGEAATELLGSGGFLSKPYRPEELVRRIGSLLEKRDSAD